MNPQSLPIDQGRPKQYTQELVTHGFSMLTTVPSRRSEMLQKSAGKGNENNAAGMDSVPENGNRSYARVAVRQVRMGNAW